MDRAVNIHVTAADLFLEAQWKAAFLVGPPLRHSATPVLRSYFDTRKERSYHHAADH